MTETSSFTVMQADSTHPDIRTLSSSSRCSILPVIDVRTVSRPDRRFTC